MKEAPVAPRTTSLRSARKRVPDSTEVGARRQSRAEARSFLRNRRLRRLANLGRDGLAGLGPPFFICLLGACDGPAATAPARVLTPGLEVCAAHASDDRLLGYCLAANAVKLQHLPVATVCGQVTNHARECRHNWATARARWSPNTPLAELLEVCRGDSDCAFDVLDTRNPRELVVTVGHCREFVPDHARDCVGHAVARWADLVTTSEEVAQIASADLGDPEMVGFHLATAVVCREIAGAVCPDSGDKAQACAAREKQLRGQPSLCPEIPPHVLRQRGR